MGKLSKIVSFLLLFMIIGLLSYKTYLGIKVERDTKLWLVLNKKVIEKANQCVLERKCSNKTVTIQYLMDHEYLISVVNPVNKEMINPNSYVDLETNQFVILH